MKQNITEKQFKELSKNSRAKLRFWFERYKGDLVPGTVDSDLYGGGYYEDPFLSIGQMIEFLDKKDKDWKIEKTTYHERGGWFWSVNGRKQYQRFLCDALWEAVKEVLETN